MRNSFVLSTFTFTLVACSPGSGDVNVNTYGEDYIEVEIPAAATPDEEGLVDGFTLTYSKFLIALSSIHLHSADGAEGGEMSEQKIFDVQKKGPTPVHQFSGLEAVHYDEVSIEVGPAKGATAGNAAPTDVALMNDRGYSVYATGNIATGTTSVEFAWGFTTNTRYQECEDAEGAAGVVVPNGGAAQIQFTVHGDHFFYDDLQSPDTKLRATAIFGADANRDGEVTLAELGAVDLTTLPTGQYGTGGDGSVENLQQFVTDLSRTLVHFQGEGECKVVKQ